MKAESTHSVFVLVFLEGQVYPASTRPAWQATEAGFLRRRRAEVGACASFTAAEEVARCAAVASADVQSAKMLAEASHQRSKFYLNKVQAYLDGALLESEVDADLVAVAEAFKAKQQAADKARVAREGRAAALLAPRPPDIRHRPVYVDLRGSTEAVRACLANYQVVASLNDADVFAVADAASPGQRTLWTAVLCGGSVVDHTFLCTQGRQGVAFVYDGANTTKRAVFVCRKFAASFPNLTSIVRLAAERPASKWQLLRNWADFAASSTAASKRKRPFEAIALTDAATAAALKARNVFCKQQFIKFLQRVACGKRSL